MTTNTSTSDKKWFDDLIVELRLRQVNGPAIGDTVASARELLADSGQHAEDAFGPARDYAAALDLPRDARSRWRNATLWPALGGLAAFLGFMQALVPGATGEPLLVSPAQLALLGVTVVLIALLPLYLDVAIRHPWVLGLLFIVGGAAGFLSSVVAPGTIDDAWLVLAAWPWLVGLAATMIVISVGNTIRTLRRGNVDDITDPRQAPTAGRKRSTSVLALVTDWLFPLFSAMMFAVVMLTQP